MADIAEFRKSQTDAIEYRIGPTNGVEDRKDPTNVLESFKDPTHVEERRNDAAISADAKGFPTNIVGAKRPTVWHPEAAMGFPTPKCWRK